MIVDPLRQILDRTAVNVVARRARRFGEHELEVGSGLADRERHQAPFGRDLGRKRAADLALSVAVELGRVGDLDQIHPEPLRPERRGIGRLARLEPDFFPGVGRQIEVGLSPRAERPGPAFQIPQVVAEQKTVAGGVVGRARGREEGFRSGRHVHRAHVRAVEIAGLEDVVDVHGQRRSRRRLDDRRDDRVAVVVEVLTEMERGRGRTGRATGRAGDASRGQTPAAEVGFKAVGQRARDRRALGRQREGPHGSRGLIRRRRHRERQRVAARRGRAVAAEVELERHGRRRTGRQRPGQLRNRARDADRGVRRGQRRQAHVVERDVTVVDEVELHGH